MFPKLTTARSCRAMRSAALRPKATRQGRRCSAQGRAAKDRQEAETVCLPLLPVFAAATAAPCPPPRWAIAPHLHHTASNTDTRLAKESPESIAVKQIEARMSNFTVSILSGWSSIDSSADMFARTLTTIHTYLHPSTFIIYVCTHAHEITMTLLYMPSQVLSLARAILAPIAAHTTAYFSGILQHSSTAIPACSALLTRTDRTCSCSWCRSMIFYESA